MAESPGPSQFEKNTTYHVGRAQAGEAESLEWIITRFTPLLLVNARYRLKALGEFYEPEDIAQEVWLITLPRLSSLSDRDGRLTPVLVKFLSTTLVLHVTDLYRKHIENKPAKRSLDAADGESISDPNVELISRLLRREEEDLVLAALEELDEASRSVLVLRGMEGLPYKEIETILGRDHKVLSMVYKRAVEKLRERLPDSVFDEFESD